MNKQTEELLNSLKKSVGDSFEKEKIFINSKKKFINLLNTDQLNQFNEEYYNSDNSIQYYKNFLHWLFKTFNQNEDEFRRSCFLKFNNLKNKRLLITGCGLGNDIAIARKFVGSKGFIHVQDLSEKFIKYASKKYVYDNVIFTVSDAQDLPYKDNYFDAVFHFGGINLFGNIEVSILEMFRVLKNKGSIIFGDESISPNLKHTDYGKMFIENSSNLWAAELPLNFLPYNATNIEISYVLGNCFYLIKFTKDMDFPNANLNVIHKGYRGGSVKKRYYGKLEGIDPILKNKFYNKVLNDKDSVSNILECLIKQYLSK